MSKANLLRELTPGVTTFLDTAVRSGTAKAPLDDFVADFAREVDLRPMNQVVDQALYRFSRADRARSDAWLGPRLHHTLRLTRQEAARRGVWLYLAVAARPDYVVWRWADVDTDPEEPAGLDRFAGPDYKHAFARLWWMTEVFRDGDDYGPAAKALSNQDIVNNLFRMDIAHHRPTALAAVSVLFPPGRAPLSGREANALAKAANAAATTLQLDALALDPGLNDSAARQWIDGARDVDPVKYFDELPSGPLDPSVDERELGPMTTLLGQLLAEAPVRGRPSTTPGPEDEVEAEDRSEHVGASDLA